MDNNKIDPRVFQAETVYEQQMAGVVGAGPSMANEAASVAQGLDGWTIKRHEDGWIFFKRPDDFRQSVTPEESMGSHAQTLHMLLDALLAQAAPPAAPAAAPAGDGLRRDQEAAYNSIDRFLRNNLCDEDYAEYSAELDSLLAAPAAPATGESGAEPVGHAGSMPGTDGFTMACFKAADVPIGTALYTSLPAAKSEAASQPGEMGVGVAHELQFILNVMEDVKAGLETKAVHRITLGKAIEKARALLLAAPCDASPTSPLHKFLNAAAGEGLVLDGVDAADLYIATFPKEYEAQSAQIVTRATSAQQEMGAGVPIDVTKVPGYVTPAQSSETAAAHAKLGVPQGPCDCSACVKMRGHLYGDQPAASAQQDEREAFESAYIQAHCDDKTIRSLKALRDGDGYIGGYRHLADAWNGWKLRGAKQAHAGALDDGVIREIVNQLRDIAIHFHSHQQLRARIASVVVPRLKSANQVQADAGAVYQYSDDGENWTDVDWMTYQSIDSQFRRIVYTRPAAESDKRDAERYRWLREEAQYFAYGRAPSVVLCDENDMFEKGEAGSESGFISGKKLDDAIDAAMSREQSGGDRGEDCARSHPHENMSHACEAKTIQAREINAKAQERGK